MSDAGTLRDAAAARRIRTSVTRFAGHVWRAVEAQHVASTMALVDTLDEQKVLEDVLEDGKPPMPATTSRLDYLLATPFRYRPPPGGSRFRGDNDPGVFYAADAVRTACAELGYWRWRHLADSPSLAAMPTKPQTVFRVKVAAAAVDLRVAPFVLDRARWTDADDYRPSQAFARAAREAGVQAIRYESVRDPEHGGCCALLRPDGFAARAHAEPQTWWLSVFRDRVVWQRAGSSSTESFEFLATGWRRAAPSTRPATPKRAKSGAKRGSPS